MSPAVVRGVGGAVREAAVVGGEPDQPRILHPVVLLDRGRQQDALAEVGRRIEPGDVRGRDHVAERVQRRAAVPVMEQLWREGGDGCFDVHAREDAGRRSRTQDVKSLTWSSCSKAVRSRLECQRAGRIVAVARGPRRGAKAHASPGPITASVNSIDEMWPSPIARSAYRHTELSCRRPDWSGCSTALGLQRAAASTAYSAVKSGSEHDRLVLGEGFRRLDA